MGPPASRPTGPVVWHVLGNLSTTHLLALSALVRLLLIFWGELQDRLGPVPYTDIDYNVFTDAARFVAQGASPYKRSTYRYSPLLAYLMLPNIWVSPVWGKFLFCTLDIVVGYLTAQLMQRLAGNSKSTRAIANTAVIAWLYNPYTFTISTRGSCDVLVVVLLLGTLWYLQAGAASHAAVTYGLAVHLRVYPIIYAPSIVLFLAARSMYKHAKRQVQVQALKGIPEPIITGLRWPRTRRDFDSLWLHVVLHGIFFGLMSGGLFILLGLLFYRLYGQVFLDEAFLHHVSRKDPRHNFSIYFYHIYLTYFAPATSASTPSPADNDLAVPDMETLDMAGATLDPMSQLVSQLGQWLNGLAEPTTLAFVPQVLLLVAISCKLHAHLPLCWLTLTMVFVSLNKVCTAQYFVWWLSLLPLLLHDIVRPIPWTLIMAALGWVLAQVHWLGWAYLLEFQGQPVFLGVWAASVVFLAANVVLLAQLLIHVRPATSFLALSVSNAGNTSSHTIKPAEKGKAIEGSDQAVAQAVEGSDQAAAQAVDGSTCQTRVSDVAGEVTGDVRRRGSRQRH